jgi:AraC-like DNA-binding protein
MRQTKVGVMGLELRWKGILGQLQPLGQNTVDAYLTDNMGVFITKQPMSFNEVEHIHRGFEFIIPSGPASVYKLQTKTVRTEHHKILPLNPEQPHIALDDTPITTLVALFFDVQFLNNIAKSIAKTADLSFANMNFEYDAHLKNILHEFIKELKFKQSGYDLITQSIAIEAGIYLLRRLRSNCLLKVAERHYDENKTIARAIDFMHANYQTGFSLNDLAQAANLSPYHFSRVFKAEVGKTPMEYLVDLKIKHAKELLQKCKDMSITEICFESGFNNLSHFSRTFYKKVGVTPTTYIEKAR